ncbi:MAG: AI-2E family transporter [Clostridia bacterium]|nr:AI-2E family transporter [Clostridia bacterium]
MKFDWKKALKISLCAFGLFLAITYWRPFISLLGVIFSAINPLIIGGIIAFIVNILMSRYEKWFFPKKNTKAISKMRRPLCMILAFLTVAVVFAAVVWLIVPQLISCIQIMLSFAAKTPTFMKEFIEKANNWNFVPDKVIEYLSAIDWESKIDQFVTFVTAGVGDVVNTVAKTVVGIISGVVTGVLGLIFSIYLLLDKDRLKRQFKKLAENYFPEKAYGKLFYFVGILNESFRKFFVGQITEAVILGGLCTFGMMIFGFPFATMIGALIAVTALIPIAGAYIGAITGALMILTVSPIKALWFIVFILVLQQLEGNIIYPKVVGSSIGLPGLWVLVAVTVGGGCYGVVGMLVGVPLFSAVYRIIKEDIEKKNKAKSSVRTSEAIQVANDEKNEDITDKTGEN